MRTVRISDGSGLVGILMVLMILLVIALLCFAGYFYLANNPSPAFAAYEAFSTAYAQGNYDEAIALSGSSQLSYRLDQEKRLMGEPGKLNIYDRDTKFSIIKIEHELIAEEFVDDNTIRIVATHLRKVTSSQSSDGRWIEDDNVVVMKEQGGAWKVAFVEKGLCGPVSPDTQVPESYKPPVVNRPAAPAAVDPNDSTLLGCVRDGVAAKVISGHHVQVWKVDPEYTRAGAYELSMQHSERGESGSFYFTVWTDQDSDGLPDKEIARSPAASADRANEWSSWRFDSPGGPLFVGSCWSKPGVEIFWTKGPAPAGYRGIGSTLFYSRSFNTTPRQKASPRYTSIRLKLL